MRTHRSGTKPALRYRVSLDPERAHDSGMPLKQKAGRHTSKGLCVQLAPSSQTTAEFEAEVHNEATQPGSKQKRSSMKAGSRTQHGNESRKPWRADCCAHHWTPEQVTCSAPLVASPLAQFEACRVHTEACIGNTASKNKSTPSSQTSGGRQYSCQPGMQTAHC